MGLFSKKKVVPSLEDLHEAAHATSQGVVDLFHGFVSDLRSAANQHDEVAAKAKAEADAHATRIAQLEALSADAATAAADKARKAEAIESLLVS